MQLILTIADREQGFARDFEVHAGQRICDTLQVLQEAGLLDAYPPVCMVRSVRSQRFRNLERTYEEAGICQGDLLEILREKRRENAPPA